MAPEQYVGEGIDHRVDLFAAGVLLYRMLAGRAPFSGSPETAMYRILNEKPVAPSQVAIAGWEAPTRSLHPPPGRKRPRCSRPSCCTRWSGY